MVLTVSIRVRVVFRNRPIYRHRMVFQIPVAPGRSSDIEVFVNIVRENGIWVVDNRDPNESTSDAPDDLAE